MSATRSSSDPFDSLAADHQATAYRRRAAVILWAQLDLLGKANGLDRSGSHSIALGVLSKLGMPVSGRTLYNWRRAWRADGLPGLVDFRTADRARWKRFGPFFVQLEHAYSTRLVELPVAFRMVADEWRAAGREVPPERDAEAFVRRYLLPGLTTEPGGAADDGEPPPEARR